MKLHELFLKVLSLRDQDILKSPVSKVRSPRGWLLYLQEECNELLEVIDDDVEGARDMDAFMAELGDVVGNVASLLLSLQQRGVDLDRIIASQESKYRRRKPWVFGDDPYPPTTPAEEMIKWRVNKIKERFSDEEISKILGVLEEAEKAIDAYDAIDRVLVLRDGNSVAYVTATTSADSLIRGDHAPFGGSDHGDEAS